jgi:hypothetical protein
MPAPWALGQMDSCPTYTMHGMRKYVGFDSLDRSCGRHALIPRAQRLNMREARSADTVSRGLRSKRISRGRKQDTGALNKVVFVRPGGRYSRF